MHKTPRILVEKTVLSEKRIESLTLHTSVQEETLHVSAWTERFRTKSEAVEVVSELRARGCCSVRSVLGPMAQALTRSG